MAQSIFDAKDLQSLAGVRKEAPGDVPPLVRFFTDLADLADNELFYLMELHDGVPGKLSVLARSHYDKDLQFKVVDKRKTLDSVKHRQFADAAYAEVTKALESLRSTHPEQARAEFEALIEQLLDAAQVVGSGRLPPPDRRSA